MIGAVKKYLYAKVLKLRLKKKHTVLNTVNVEKDITIGRWSSVSKRVILGEEVQIGDFTYLNASKYWTTVESKVKIGSFCSIAPLVHIGAGNHNYSYVTTHPVLFDGYYQPFFKCGATRMADGLSDNKSVTVIGNDVWIGFGAIIKRGITIGNGAVIAGGSVVVKDVPPYAIVGGNPARIIKYRTSEENIKFFAENDAFMLWNWSDSDISENIDCLYDFEKYRTVLMEKVNK